MKEVNYRINDNMKETENAEKREYLDKMIVNVR